MENTNTAAVQTKTILSAVDQSLTWYDPTAITQELVDAYQLTLTFSQAAARAVNSDPASEEYFTAMTTELAKLGWNITSAGKTHYDQIANKISPASIVKSITDPYLDKQGQDELAGVLDVIKTPDTSVTGFVDFFWKKASVNANKSNMAIGKLESYLNSPKITLLYYAFDYHADSARSLFVEVSNAKLVENINHLTMSLDMALYKTYEQTLKDKLTGKEKEHIKDVKIDL